MNNKTAIATPPANTAPFIPPAKTAGQLKVKVVPGGANYMREHKHEIAATGSDYAARATEAIKNIDALLDLGQKWLTKDNERESARQRHNFALYAILANCAGLEKQMSEDSKDAKTLRELFAKRYMNTLSHAFDEERKLSGILLLTFNKGYREANDEFKANRSKYKSVLDYAKILIGRKELAADTKAIYDWLCEYGLENLRYEYLSHKKSLKNPNSQQPPNPLDTLQPLADVIDSNGRLSAELTGNRYELAVLRVNGDGTISVVQIKADQSLRKRAGIR